MEPDVQLFEYNQDNDIMLTWCCMADCATIYLLHSILRSVSRLVTEPVMIHYSEFKASIQPKKQKTTARFELALPRESG